MITTHLHAELEDVWINAEVVHVTPATPLTPARVELATGHTQEFDAVILAMHTDTSLKVLGQTASQVWNRAAHKIVNSIACLPDMRKQLQRQV